MCMDSGARLLDLNLASSVSGKFLSSQCFSFLTSNIRIIIIIITVLYTEEIKTVNLCILVRVV